MSSIKDRGKMLNVGFTALLASALLSRVWAAVPSGPAQTYANCQRKTCKPLDGCPNGTLYVSHTDPAANFTTVQAAIASLPNDTTPYWILIAPGNYTEQLNVTRQGPLTLLGVSDWPSSGSALANNITADTPEADYANEVSIRWSSANNNSAYSDNAFTSVLTVAPNLNASLTGSGPTGFAVPDSTPFGCADFRAYNVDFRNDNDGVAYSYGPALAISVSRANAGFYSCGFYSWQDTVYVGKLGRAYVWDGVVAGQTDFLYGFGTAYLEQSALSLRGCGGGVTAWKGTNTTSPNTYGVYVDRSRLVAANASVQAQIVGRCALGRPWNDADRTVFMESYFDASIKPQGFIEWSSSDPRVDAYTFMATWNCSGPGYNVTAERASNVTMVLTDDEVAPYRYPADVFRSQDGSAADVQWIDQSVLVGS
jgi:pectin methylesterase-like acyl-CoA thioesterase